MKALLEQGVPIYDVRRPEEWRQTGVVAGSHKLTFVDGSGRLHPDFIPTFTREVPRELMEKRGYAKVCNVRNGITRWIGEGNPVVRN